MLDRITAKYSATHVVVLGASLAGIILLSGCYSVSCELGPNHVPKFQGFHIDATRDAVALFTQSRKNPFYKHDDDEDARSLFFGLAFADDQWTACPRCLKKNASDIWFGSNEKVELANIEIKHEHRDICGPLVDEELDGWLSVGVRQDKDDKLVNPFYSVRWRIKLDVHIHVWWMDDMHEDIPELIAADNLFHFVRTDQPIYLTDYGSYGNWVCNVSAADLGLKDIPIAQTKIPTATYASHLFRLARKFWPGSPGMPSQARDLRLVNEPGAVFLRDHRIDLPPTYLGGQPFMCFGKPITSGNTVHASCATGHPSWPWWMAKTEDDGRPTQRQAIARELQESNPGKSVATALTYLGWAIHLVQDSAVSYHQSNLQGKFHPTGESAIESYYRGHSEQIYDILRNWPELAEFEQRVATEGNAKACEEIGLPLGTSDEAENGTILDQTFTDMVERYVGDPSTDDGKMLSGVECVRRTYLMLACFANMGATHPIASRPGTGT